MNLCIALAATSKYLYAWKSCVRQLLAASCHKKDVSVIYVSDETEECREAFDLLKRECPQEWNLQHRPLKLNGGEKYKIEEQLLIAKMHGEMFSAARKIDADQCWTVEADVLVRPDSLRMLEWALQMPQADGIPYYDVAICTYPNGLFIGGHGSPQNPIAEDFLPSERQLTKELKKQLRMLKREEKAYQKDKKLPDEAWQKKAKEIYEAIKKCPPNGNIWELNAKHGWRRRGWMDYAYPGIGQGAMVPTDWVGQGCNLLSRKALALSSFDGYDGQGTQDLFLCWRRYHPAGLNLACITHSPCDHVKREDGKLMHYQAFHEQLGETRGHLRVMKKEWIEL